MIEALKPLTKSSFLTSGNVSKLKDKFKYPIILLEDDDETEKINKLLYKEHYSTNYHLLKKENFNTDISNIVSTDFLSQIKLLISSLIKNSLPEGNTSGGVFLLIKDVGQPTPLHSHTLDLHFSAPMQKAFWWNEKKELPNFWFEKNNEKVFWPKEISNTNSYLLDTKIPHAGDPVSCITLFMITFGRKFI